MSTQLKLSFDLARLEDGDPIQGLQRWIEARLEEADPEAALKELKAIRERLAECLQLAEDAIRRLAEHQELLVPDTDPVCHVPATRVRRMPDEDTPLSCDPDDRPDE